MRVNGLMTREREEGSKNIPMVTFMKENLKITKLMGREYISGGMEKCMMDNGIWELKKVMEFGEEYWVTVT